MYHSSSSAFVTNKSPSGAKSTTKAKNQKVAKWPKCTLPVVMLTKESGDVHLSFLQCVHVCAELYSDTIMAGSYAPCTRPYTRACTMVLIALFMSWEQAVVIIISGGF